MYVYPTGLYHVELHRQRATKVFALPESHLPKYISADHITHYFKYDSGTKAFKEIPGIKQLSSTTDACVIARAKRSAAAGAGAGSKVV
jgi:hypothetical protein